jgi:mannosylglycerate hydrolase
MYYSDTRYGVQFLGRNFRYAPQISGISYHKADVRHKDEDYFLIEPKPGYHPEMLKEGIERAWKGTDDTLVPEHRLFLNGCDFSTPQPDLTKLLRDANALYDDREFLNTGLEEYVEQLQAHIAPDSLRVVKGEMRDGPACDCSGNALVSRIYIKQLNKQVQNVLLKQTEPFLVLLQMLGVNYDDTLLEKAWEYVLKSHPHDSINGVTQDKTADDVMYRLKQALEISEVLYERATADLLKQIDLSHYQEDDLFFVVFNSLPRPVSEVIKVSLDTPREQEIWDFTIVNPEGRNVLAQHISREERTYPVHDLDGRPWPYVADRHICYVQCENIPAYGYTVYKIVPKTTFRRDFHYWLPMRTSAGEDLASSPTHLENEWLAVAINPDGTFDLTAKATGQTYRHLHYFEDAGDVGNYWTYYPPYNNQIHTSQGAPTRIWLEENGPLAATVAVEKMMTIPAYAFEPLYGVQGESKCSAETSALVITSRLTLKRHAQKLDITTQVNNTAGQHRLRVAFPTGIQAEYTAASGHFTVDQRPAKPVRKVDGEFYPEIQTLPMQHFVDVSDGQQGLAFLNNGLMEYELADTPEKTLYLTLFRSVTNMIVTGWRCVNRFPEQKGSLLLREMEFEYSIYPHAGAWQEANVYAQAEELNVPLFPIQVSHHAQGTLPQSLSLFSIEPENLILSVLKRAEDRDSYIVRLFNPTHKTIAGNLRFYTPVKAAYRVTLNEQRVQEISLVDPGVIPIEVEHHKIVTVELVVS